MISNMPFAPLGEEFKVAATATPSTPAQIPTWGGTSQFDVARVVVFNASGSSEVKVAYAPTSAGCSTLAGAGGDGAAGSNIANSGIMSFIGPSSTEKFSFPPGSYFSVWCAVAAQTADVYITPGSGL